MAWKPFQGGNQRVPRPVVRIAIVTLFPEMFEAFLRYGVLGRAVSNGSIQVCPVNPRDFATDRHQTVDDRPYGGGPGMVMRVEPLRRALEAAQRWLRAQGSVEHKVIYLSPQGRRFAQADAKSLSLGKDLILVAGRYEGIDERFIAAYVDEEWSIGDYVLSGGELPAMVLIDAVGRLLPGVLGDAESAVQDSFVDGLLDCPHYTRPPTYDGADVPGALLSGDHQRIARWRMEQALLRTWQRRPDLFEKLQLDEEQKAILDECLARQAEL